MDPLAVASLTTAITGLVASGIGFWRARQSDQRDEIADLWRENRELRADMKSLHIEVVGLRADVDHLHTEKAQLRAENAELARQLAEALRGPP